VNGTAQRLRPSGFHPGRVHCVQRFTRLEEPFRNFGSARLWPLVVEAHEGETSRQILALSLIRKLPADLVRAVALGLLARRSRGKAGALHGERLYWLFHAASNQPPRAGAQLLAEISDNFEMPPRPSRAMQSGRMRRHPGVKAARARAGAGSHMPVTAKLCCLAWRPFNANRPRSCWRAAARSPHATRALR